MQLTVGQCALGAIASAPNVRNPEARRSRFRRLQSGAGQTGVTPVLNLHRRGLPPRAHEALHRHCAAAVGGGQVWRRWQPERHSRSQRGGLGRQRRVNVTLLKWLGNIRPTHPTRQRAEPAPPPPAAAAARRPGGLSLIATAGMALSRRKCRFRRGGGRLRRQTTGTLTLGLVWHTLGLGGKRGTTPTMGISSIMTVV